MTFARPVFKCPLCGELSPLSSLVADDRGVEMTCAQCENSVRFKTFSPSDIPGSTASSKKEIVAPNKPEQEPGDFANHVAQTKVNDETKSEDLIALLNEIPNLNTELAEDYRQVVTTGDDLEGHKILVKRAAVLDQLKEFGRLHKLRLERDSDDFVAKACQEQIIALAIAKLKPKKIEMAGGADKSKQTVIITLSLLVIVAAIAWMLHQGLL